MVLQVTRCYYKIVNATKRTSFNHGYCSRSNFSNGNRYAKKHGYYKKKVNIHKGLGKTTFESEHAL